MVPNSPRIVKFTLGPRMKRVPESQKMSKVSKSSKGGKGPEVGIGCLNLLGLQKVPKGQSFANCTKMYKVAKGI